MFNNVLYTRRRKKINERRRTIAFKALRKDEKNEVY